jgi:hypothetical protein
MPLEQELYGLAGGRKERVLHARIPPALDQALKQQARRLHVPVSRLIRDLLADAISRELETDLQGPVGWQTLILSNETACQTCGKMLPANGDAYIAIYGRSSAPKIVCGDCKTRSGA